MPTPTVVFMANDAVYDQAVVFLESLRTFNPLTKVRMIPFADNISKLLELRRFYEFDIVDADLARWDILAARFFPDASQAYVNRLRKLAVFDIEGDAVIYLDIDIIVLHDLTFLAQPIAAGKAQFLCAATRNDPWVYNELYLDCPLLKRARRFSDGFFVFNPQTISTQIAYRLITEHEELYKKVRAKDVYCQPVTNLIIDLLGFEVKEVFELYPHISPHVWYMGEELSEVDGVIKEADGRTPLFLHWAGPVDLSTSYRFKRVFELYATKAAQRLTMIESGDGGRGGALPLIDSPEFRTRSR